MPCQIGITMNPARRKQEWLHERPTLRNWQILGVFLSKSDAQKAETLLAAQQGCESSPGGTGEENAFWSVYKFDFNSSDLKLPNPRKSFGSGP